MWKRLKYFLYVIFFSVILLIFIRSFNGSISPNSANAYEYEKQVNVYFGNEKMGSPEDCAKVFPVSRTVLNAETLGPGALAALLGGVSEKEKVAGYSSSLNPEALIQKFEIKNRVAYVDFNEHFGEVAGSCRVTAIKSQIEKTLTDLTYIDSVVISVNGKTKGILEP